MIQEAITTLQSFEEAPQDLRTQWKTEVVERWNPDDYHKILVTAVETYERTGQMKDLEGLNKDALEILRVADEDNQWFLTSCESDSPTRSYTGTWSEYDSLYIDQRSWPESMLITPLMLNYILEHADTCKKVMPGLTEKLEKHTQLGTLEKVELLYHPPGFERTEADLPKMSPAALDSLVYININELRDPDKCSEWITLLDITSGKIGTALHNITKKETLDLLDIDNLWSEVEPDMRRRIISLEYWDQLWFYTTLAEGVQDAVDVEIPKFPLYDLLDENPKKVSSLALRMSDQINERFITSLFHIENDIHISEEQLDAIRILCMNDTHKNVYLAEKEDTSGLVVLPNYKKYSSCYETENRLAREIFKEEAVLLRIDFPDGTTSLLAVKFEEVYLAAALQSTNPAFEEGTSYLPIGKTLEYLDHLRSQKSKYATVEVGSEEALNNQLIFGPNRSLVYSTEEFEGLLSKALESEARYIALAEA
jgi:hypothetical protein